MYCYLAYCNAYPDLKNAFCSGEPCTTDTQVEACRNHWVRHGGQEGRGKGKMVWGLDPVACASLGESIGSRQSIRKSFQCAAVSSSYEDADSECVQVGEVGATSTRHTNLQEHLDAKSELRVLKLRIAQATHNPQTASEFTYPCNAGLINSLFCILIQ